MSDWKLASDWGILRNGKDDDPNAAWHAGRLFDALRVGPTAGGPLLVANDGSGVWIVNESGGPAIPLSTTWAFPNVACLAQGTRTPEHIYAGGSVLSETDTTQPAPLLNWHQITVRDAGRKVLNIGTINRIVVVRELQKIVLACDNGVFWATIPPPGSTYSFTKAATLPDLRFSGLAEGPANTVIAAAWGTDLKTHFGIFVGTWGAAMGPLTFKPAKITGIDPRQMRRTDLAACATDRKVLYAVCGGGNNSTPVTDPMGNVTPDPFGNVQWVNDVDYILSVLRSGDGGLTWRPTGATVTGQTLPLFPGMSGSDLAGTTYDGYTGCVGVSPTDASQVAIGIASPFLSLDAGKTWTMFSESTIPHLHADLHGVVFDPTDAKTLHLCCDGGLATTPDLGATWGTAANRQLPNLELYQVAASPKDSGLLAGALQDNGNLYAPLYIASDPWKHEDDGDGVSTTFLTGGDLLRQNNGMSDTDPSGATVEYGRKARDASWDAGGRQFHDRQMFPNPPLSRGVVPVDGTGDGLAVPAGQDNQELIEAVTTPTFANAQGELMVAVGVSLLAVFGLFAKSDGTFHWQPIGTVPSLPDKDKMGNALPYFATAVASPDGTFVFVGMNTGKVFRLDAPGVVADPPVFTVDNLSDPVVSTQVTRFAAFAPEQAFLIAGAGVFRRVSAGWTALTGKMLPGGVSALLPVGQQYSALAADPTTAPPTLFVATNLAVFRSEDNGETWFTFTGGLPTAPGCNDLRWVQESSGANFLYLAAFGWSVFRRLLNVDELLKPVVVDGHMDLIDRTLFGSDDITHPTFGGTRMLGPLHPFETMSFTEDDTGTEVRGVLKLDFAWKTDFSVVLTVSADLIDRDEDEVDAHADTVVTIPFGTVETVVIDLKSDDVEPDRAHIEFTVTN